MTFAEAMVEALSEIMEADERVQLIGGYFLGLSPRRVLLGRQGIEPWPGLPQYDRGCFRL